MSDEQSEREPTQAELALQSKAAAARRMQQPGRWAETQVEQAIRNGDFDDLPGLGKPIGGLGAQHDPDWWLKNLVEREQLSVLPPALAIRKDDAELDARLDRLGAESEVRRVVGEFNEAVAKARIQPLGGPPMITAPRDVEAEVVAWRERRDVRRREQAEQLTQHREATGSRGRGRRTRWWRRGARPAS